MQVTIIRELLFSLMKFDQTLHFAFDLSIDAYMFAELHLPDAWGLIVVKHSSFSCLFLVAMHPLIKSTFSCLVQRCSVMQSCLDTFP